LAIDKNLATVIKAVSLMEPEWQLVLVGEPSTHLDERHTVEDLCEKYLPDRHRVFPWAHHVGDILAATDVFVLVSDYEGFSNALAEAWLAGVPSVFSRCGSVEELERRHGNIGVVVNTGIKPERLARKIHSALSPKNKVGIENIRRVMRGITEEDSARQWEDLFEQTISDRTRTPKTRVAIIHRDSEVWVRSIVDYAPHGLIRWDIILDHDLNSVHQAMNNADVLVVLANSEASIDTDRPLILVADRPEVNSTLVPLATDFVAISEAARLAFPVEVQRSVVIIPQGISMDSVPLKDGQVIRLEHEDEDVEFESKTLDQIVAGHVGPLICPEIALRPVDDDLDVDVLVVSQPADQLVLKAWMTGVPVVSADMGIFREANKGVVPMGVELLDNVVDAVSQAIKMTPDHLEQIRQVAYRDYHCVKVSHRWSQFLDCIQKKYQIFSPEDSIGDKIRRMLRKKHSLKAIARHLNQQQIPVPNGDVEWTYKTVKRYSEMP
jgi:hypothetical protein